MVAIRSEVVEIRPLQLRPPRLAEQQVPDVQFLAGDRGQPGQAACERQVAVIVDDDEARADERRVGRQPRCRGLGREVQQIGQRRVAGIELAPALHVAEIVVDHLLDEPVRLAEQQAFEDADIGRRYRGHCCEAAETPRRQVGRGVPGGAYSALEGFPEVGPDPSS